MSDSFFPWGLIRHLKFKKMGLLLPVLIPLLLRSFWYVYRVGDSAGGGLCCLVCQELQNRLQSRKCLIWIHSLNLLITRIPLFIPCILSSQVGSSVFVLFLLLLDTQCSLSSSCIVSFAYIFEWFLLWLFFFVSLPPTPLPSFCLNSFSDSPNQYLICISLLV